MARKVYNAHHTCGAEVNEVIFPDKPGFKTRRYYMAENISNSTRLDAVRRGDTTCSRCGGNLTFDIVKRD